MRYAQEPCLVLEPENPGQQLAVSSSNSHCAFILSCPSMHLIDDLRAQYDLYPSVYKIARYRARAYVSARVESRSIRCTRPVEVVFLKPHVRSTQLENTNTKLWVSSFAGLWMVSTGIYHHYFQKAPVEYFENFQSIGAKELVTWDALPQDLVMESSFIGFTRLRTTEITELGNLLFESMFDQKTTWSPQKFAKIFLRAMCENKRLRFDPKDLPVHRESLVAMPFVNGQDPRLTLKVSQFENPTDSSTYQELLLCAPHSGTESSGQENRSKTHLKGRLTRIFSSESIK
ncbi:hypothetical protein NEOLI_004095 [Neolecta irregularis DAH-3]|uniref:Uncharacterized protein n=1 Tax=Neolecta irregularis (strain DAH-3) TaxID=1198029 RepID=A0A1U7LLV9_NEOID|nr:hypothetical protein NEOLI_004095 [Neolecta irregularis DAH-3]|eukprot:OLL23629.1 hypothetical protein NEOLI_004095 [Neolecta irregularis DAH-3]